VGGFSAGVKPLDADENSLLHQSARPLSIINRLP
jgi:hypothetical protein